MQYKILPPLLLSTLLVGCVDADTEKEPATDSFDSVQEAGKADSLGSQLKVVNAGALPAALTVDHTATPRYSAVSFKSKEKSKLDLWVRSSVSDPVAWLLDSNFKVLAQNDDSEGTDSHIKLKTPKTGRYYLVFRDYYEDPGLFKVSLKGEAPIDPFDPADPFDPVDPTDPADPTDPFSTESCSGPLMSRADGLTLFAPGSNATDLLGAASLHTRKRICSTLTGCQPWTNVGSSGTLFPGWIEDLPIVHTCGSSNCSTGAGRFMQGPQISLRSIDSSIYLSLDSYKVEGSPSIAGFSAKGIVDSDGLENVAFSYARNTGYAGQFWIKLGETIISEVPVTLTNTCVRAVLNGTRQLDDPAQILELESVLLGQI